MPTTITLRSIKGSALTHNEVDDNFSNLKTTADAALPTASLGTGIATALAVNVGSAGAPVLFDGAGGTPSSLTLTNATGLPIAGIASLGTGVAAAMANAVNAAGGFLTHGNAAVLTANTFTATQTVNPAANTSAIVVSGGSITGSGTTVPGLTVSGTLNTSGAVIGAGLNIAITDTASNANSSLIYCTSGAAGTTAQFVVYKGGNIALRGIAGIGSNAATIDMVTSSGNIVFHGGMVVTSSIFAMSSTNLLTWSSGNPVSVASDTGLARNAAGVVEINNGSAGTFRDLKLRDLIINGATNLLKTSAALTDNAAASTATLTNSPAAGNPTKWVRIDDNGTARFLPLW